MKIIHIINSLDRGGAETLLLNIIPMVEEKVKNLQTKVIVLDNRLKLLPLFEAKGIDVEVLAMGDFQKWRRLPVLVKSIRKYNPDIVHTHLLYADKIGGIASCFAGVKYKISSIHSVEPPTNFKEKLNYFIINKCFNKFIAVSKTVKDMYVNCNIYPKEKIQIIYNAPGFETKGIKVKKKASLPMKFIAVGRLVEAKCTENMIQAFAQLKDEPVILKIFGTGEKEVMLKDMALALNLKNVEFMGQTDNVKDELSSADFFISSSLWEGLPLSVVEGISMGLPVVATSIPAHVEVLSSDGEYKYLAEINSIKSLVLKIKEIIDADYELLSTKSLRLARKFTISQMINDYSNLYSSLAIGKNNE